ncbi:MAG: stage III sporulation protein AA [Oscillospiraceae bacterium]|nr:stage III sporulation protein AA [Oscillospiraceae bacterium]
MEKNFEKLLAKIGSDFCKNIKEKFDFNEIREIRLLSGKKAKIVTTKGNFSEGEYITPQKIRDIFASLCDFSVHTYKDDICRGFITIRGGFRIGICGTAVYEEDKIINIKDISALNIRIPHEIKNIAKELLSLNDSGILIIGPPCSGKTTLLRDFARIKSKNHFVTIVDERTEIAGIYHGESSFDIGDSTVLNGFLKSDGISIAARTMAPEYIICDEFGDEKDISSSLYAMKSGVKIIASMHALDFEDFLKKPLSQKIAESGIFGHFIILNKNCAIEKIIKAGEYQV